MTSAYIKSPVIPFLRNMSSTHIKKNNPCLDRRWMLTKDGEKLKEGQLQMDKHKFSIASYNVLCQNLMEAHPNLYVSCDSRYLSWEYRSFAFIEEIKTYLPDILCLQEVSCSKFHTFYKPNLHKLGYEGLFIKRNGDKTDGCSTFYNRSLFTIDKRLCQGIYYSPPNNRNLLRDNVAEIVALIPRFNTNVRLLISNTHLLFNPKRGDIKLWQCMRLIAELQNSKRNTFHKSYVIMCGDFNMVPLSPLFNFITNHQQDFQDYAKTEISGQTSKRRSRDTSLGTNVIPKGLMVNRNCELILNEPAHDVEYEDGVIRHNLDLHSSYVHGDRSDDNRGVTTHHDDVNETVDFIFFEKEPADDSGLVLTSVLKSLTAVDMEEGGSMPSRHFASDHTMICSEFLL